MRIDWQKHKINIFIFAVAAIFLHSIIFVSYGNIGNTFIENAISVSKNSDSSLTQFFINIHRVYNNFLIQAIFRSFLFFINFFLTGLFLRLSFIFENKLRKSLLKKNSSLEKDLLLKLVLINAFGELFLTLITFLFKNQLINFSIFGYDIYLLLL
ncbi:hypothetical protein, partial [Oenococcus oeni]